ncbi:hypothetical protein MMC13_004768 [Lambiella insularis]|nr:hypothetical protein [Lambiella insularis]
MQQVSAVLVSVTYRLAPEHPLPTAVDDGVCALLQLAAYAETLGTDASRISLSGFSAGGNLAFSVLLRLETYLRTAVQEGKDVDPPPRLVSIVACVEPSKTLPPALTDLLNASYFPDPKRAAAPYASPAATTDEALVAALPDHIALYLCEWDMLLQEGKDFGERLGRLGKRVRWEIIEERKHAFDKSMWPFALDAKVDVCHKQACGWICEVLETL